MDEQISINARKQRSPRVLYITYWGAAEPLGQSLVIPAVCKLAQLGANLTLVTFEKPADFAQADEIQRIESVLNQSSVRWIPLRYHKSPKLPATAFDILNGGVRGILDNLRGQYDIVHARTYLGGLIGMILAPMIGARWIYHNEGFYPDEQVDGGVWRANSMIHRLARSLEQRMYASADGLIALSHRARDVVENLPASRRKASPAIVVPSCVDLDRFQIIPRAPFFKNRNIRLVYTGSIGQRYIFNRVSQFVAAAGRELGGVSLRVLTRTPPAVVGSALKEAGVSDGAWSVVAVPHASVPGELAGQDAGLFFLTQGLSEHGCSPTKIGEYWASGLPVVTTPNVSDTDDIIRRHGVGVIVQEHSDQEYRRAARALRVLLGDPGLPMRCRKAAELHYSLQSACERQIGLYHSILSRSNLALTATKEPFGALG